MSDRTELMMMLEFINPGAKNPPTPGQRENSNEVHKDSLRAQAPLGSSELAVWPRALWSRLKSQWCSILSGSKCSHLFRPASLLHSGLLKRQRKGLSLIFFKVLNKIILL